MNELDFSKKAVLVVGGSSGIGNGVAHAFAERGAAVHVWGTRARAADYDGVEGSDLNGLAYADIDQDRMSRASTTSSMAQQLVQSIGIGLAASLLHFLMLARGQTHLTADSVTPAFLIIGAVTFISIFWFAPLPKGAGDEMNGRIGR